MILAETTGAAFASTGHSPVTGGRRVPIAYTIDRENGCVIETWSGDVSARELAAHWRRYLADPDVMALRRTLVDLRHSHIVFTAAELSQLVERIVLPALHGMYWRTAIVLGDTDHFEMSRRYHLVAESYSQDSVFSTTEAALAWLRSQRQTPTE
jgi:hypothetical protein